MGTLINVDVSPEKPLDVCPSFLSTSNGECAWHGSMFYWYMALMLSQSHLQIQGTGREVPEAKQPVGQGIRKDRTGTEASSSEK